MGTKKKPKKKKGCLGLLFNFVMFVVCLVVTGLLFYFAFLVVKGNPDPVSEIKKLPEQLKVLPEKIEELMNQKQADDGA